MINTGDLVKFKVYGKEFIGEVIGVLEVKDWDNKDLIGKNMYKIDTLGDTLEVLEEKIIIVFLYLLHNFLSNLIK